MLDDVILPIAVIGILATIVIAFIRMLETFMLNRTIKAAMRDHPESVAMLADKIGKREPRTDAMTGWLWLAGALALLAYAAIGGGGEEAGELSKIAIIPAIIGIALLLVHKLKRRA